MSLLGGDVAVGNSFAAAGKATLAMLFIRSCFVQRRVDASISSSAANSRVQLGTLRGRPVNFYHVELGAAFFGLGQRSDMTIRWHSGGLIVAPPTSNFDEKRSFKHRVAA